MLMASEVLLSTVIQISVTGAGLVLAIYALIIPISKKLFLHRAQLLSKQMKLFEQKRKSISPNANNKDFNQLGTLRNLIKENKRLPIYLTTGVIVTFTLFITSAFVSFLPLYNPLSNTPENDFIIMIMFFCSLIAFMFLGAFTISDISLTMKKEYEQISKIADEE